MKKGLALSGGGARSFSQIGVLKIFEREGIYFDVITGTSMGAIIGTIYSFTENAENLEEIILKIFSKKEFKNLESFFSRKKGKRLNVFDSLKTLSLFFLDIFKTGLFKSGKIEEIIYKNIKRDIYFEEAKKTLGIVASEYFSGKTVIFHKGKIIPALIASSAIPGLITPVKINDKLYMDGGVTSNLPVIANYILGGEIIIGIENNTLLKKKNPLNVFDIFVQVEKIKTNYSGLLEGVFADFVLKIELSEIEWFNFSKIKECIKIGEETTLKNLKLIEKVLNKTEKFSTKEGIIEKLKEHFLLGEPII